MEITRKTQNEVPENHVLLETYGRVHYSVPADLFVEDLETRMRNILEYLMSEDGLEAGFVLDSIFLDDKASPTITGTRISESSSGDDYYEIYGRLEDEMGL